MPVPIKILLLSMLVLVFAFESLAADDPYLKELKQQERMLAEAIELMENKAALSTKFIQRWQPYSSWSIIKKYVEEEERLLQLNKASQDAALKGRKKLTKQILDYEYAKGLMSSKERGCSDLTGSWKQTAEKSGCKESTWTLTHQQKANTYEAQESGCGNAHGEAKWNEGTRELHIEWNINEDCKGDYKWTLDSECKKSASGFLNFRSNKEPCKGNFTSTVERN